METSIIIRVKNEKENLEKLFAILKEQTYQDFEIVIVDNNSIDGSEKIVYDYFSKDRVCVVKLINSHIQRLVIWEQIERRGNIWSI
jgi:glycosyltransferase involved in cell wall biosynthesis